MEPSTSCRRCELYRERISHFLSKVLECDSVYILAEIYDKFEMTELITIVREHKNIKKQSPKCYGYLYAKFSNLKTMLSSESESKVCQTEEKEELNKNAEVVPEKNNDTSSFPLCVPLTQTTQKEKETSYLRFKTNEEEKEEEKETLSPPSSYDDEIGEYIRNAAKLLNSKNLTVTEPEEVKSNPSLCVNEGGRKHQV